MAVTKSVAHQAGRGWLCLAVSVLASLALVACGGSGSHSTSARTQPTVPGDALIKAEARLRRAGYTPQTLSRIVGAGIRLTPKSFGKGGLAAFQTYVGYALPNGFLLMVVGFDSAAHASNSFAERVGCTLPPACQPGPVRRVVGPVLYFAAPLGVNFPISSALFNKAVAIGSGSKRA